MTDALNWKPAATPKAEPIEGRFIRLEKLDPGRHGEDLWEVLQGPASDPVLWDYLPYGPFAERAAFDRWLEGNAAGRDPLFYTVIDRASGQAQGILMGRFGISAEQAFEYLRRRSQQEHIKLTDIAHEVIDEQGSKNAGQDPDQP